MDLNNLQISWKKLSFGRFGIRENMWWTRFRVTLLQHLLPNILNFFLLGLKLFALSDPAWHPQVSWVVEFQAFLLLVLQAESPHVKFGLSKKVKKFDKIS